MRKFCLDEKIILGFSFISIFQWGQSQEKVFDMHVHVWNGKQSIEDYVSQLDSTNQPVTKFGGILMAEKGKPARTKAKNDELIALSKQFRTSCQYVQYILWMVTRRYRN